MNDRLYGRRRYDEDDRDLLIRIDERVGVVLDHLEKLNGRVGKAEQRLAALEGVNDRRDGATQERGRWASLALTIGKQAIPAGGGLAGLVALAHYWSGQGTR